MSRCRESGAATGLRLALKRVRSLDKVLDCMDDLLCLRLEMSHGLRPPEDVIAYAYPSFLPTLDRRRLRLIAFTER